MPMPSARRPHNFSIYASLLAVLLVALLGGCASTPPVKQEKPEKGLEAADNIAASERPSATEDVEGKNTVEEKDPYEGFNRAMYSFNTKVDTYVASPITTAYKWITPDFLETGVSNFFNNAKTVNSVLNDVLQGKMQQSAVDTGRFLLNTTVGVGGLFDVASRVGLQKQEEDFDQTLAVWGVPKGSYLVLPFLGPTTARGIPGVVVDTAANPVTYLNYPVQILAALNARANADGALKFIDEAALDPYVFTRESYLQWRDYEASDGKSKPAAAADEFEDELEENLGESKAGPVNAAAAQAAAASSGSQAVKVSATAANSTVEQNSGGAKAGSAVTGAAETAEHAAAKQKQQAKTGANARSETAAEQPVPMIYPLANTPPW